MGVRLNAPSRFQADQDSRQRTGPAAEKLEEVQRIFSRALCARFAARLSTQYITNNNRLTPP